MASDKVSSAKDFYEDEKHLMKLCDFLRSSEGPPVREAIEMDKRVYYIKGELGELTSCVVVVRLPGQHFILIPNILKYYYRGEAGQFHGRTEEGDEMA